MKRWISIVYGLPYVWVGIGHFVDPDIFVPIVPDIIGVPFFWVYLSGVFEIVLGLGLFKEIKHPHTEGWEKTLSKAYDLQA